MPGMCIQCENALKFPLCDWIFARIKVENVLVFPFSLVSSEISECASVYVITV